MNFDNFYIKNVPININDIECWVYIIDNIKYYVPIFGYIVLFDLNFYYDSINTSNKYNINSPSLFDYNEGSVNCRKELYDSLKKIINPIEMNTYLKTESNSHLSEDVKKLLRKLYNELESSTNMISLIHKCFTKYLHNKLFNLLTKAESENIDLVFKRLYKENGKGALFAYALNATEYCWVIYKK